MVLLLVVEAKQETVVRAEEAPSGLLPQSVPMQFSYELAAGKYSLVKQGVREMDAKMKATAGYWRPILRGIVIGILASVLLLALICKLIGRDFSDPQIQQTFWGIIAAVAVTVIVFSI